ncbi:hypothetical protein CNBG_9503 [Cryptococcus deuterogattii R265]|uniref:uncharacterized protein n=1 Tax=Cryptococcus deuterogattii (strain R265) TaxID=294750 RepID=UPI001936718C|nr:hypothetical protein CNBG_9503 [Cryptococcus deuterogattii R265]
MPSLFTARSLSTLVGPRIILQVPSLAQLQKQAKSLGSAVSENLSSLPAYSSFQSSFPTQSHGSGVAGAEKINKVVRPEEIATLGRDHPAGLPPKLNPSDDEKSWYPSNFLDSSCSSFTAKSQPAPPPSYAESDAHPCTHPHPSQRASPNKLKKQFPGWLRLQQSIPEGEAKPQMMVGSKVYAESVHSWYPESYTFGRNLANTL